MKLEEAIQQKTPFRNARHRATVNLLFTTNWLVDLHKGMFKPYSITLQQFNVLRILRGSYPNPISTSNIRGRMLDKMSDVSRIVERLVKKGLVERTTCLEDKRLVDVKITEAGMALLSEIDAHPEDMDSLIMNLNEEEAEQLNLLLDKLRG
ncbi:MAG: MarR family transcriptional regulator [Bacteroidia bacterium]|nr:MarR family transcriptional regulator [Bacteroidia bacterium]